MKTYGGCPAMPSPGSARIVETKMGLGINKSAHSSWLIGWHLEKGQRRKVKPK